MIREGALILVVSIVTCVLLRTDKPDDARSRRCVARPTFVYPMAARILIADFRADGVPAREQTQPIATELERLLQNFETEVLAAFPMRVPANSLEVRRLPCVIADHEAAERIAALWRADVVIWGSVYQRPQTVNIGQDVSTGPIHAHGNATVNVGQVAVTMTEPYTLRIRATMARGEARIRNSFEPLDLLSEGQLDFPMLSSNSSLQVVDVALGLYFLDVGRPEITARLFERAAPQLDSLVGPDFSLLQILAGNAFLDLPGGINRAAKHLQLGYSAVAGSGTLLEAVALNNLGFMAKHKGELSTALEYYRGALETLEERFDPLRGIVLSNIGNVYESQGNHIEAETFFRDALAVHRSCCVAARITIATDLNNLALALGRQSKLSEGLALLHEALLQLESLGPKASRSRATTLSNIGWILSELGRHEEAIRYQQESLALHRQFLGSDHHATGVDLHNLGRTERALGKNYRALRLLQQSLAVMEGSVGRDHPDLIEPLNQLGRVFRDLGEQEQAVAHFQRALFIGERSHGGDEHELVTSLAHLGGLMYLAKRHAEAQKYLQRCLEIERAAHDPQHLEVGNASYRLALVLRALKNTRQADELYGAALEIFERPENASRGEHPFALVDAALLKLELRKAKEASSLLQQAVSMREVLFGEESIEVAEALKYSGYAFERLPDYSKAEAAHRRARAIYEQKRFGLYPALQTSSIARLLEAQRKCSEARAEYEHALSLLDDIAKSNHSVWLRDNVNKWLEESPCHFSGR